MRALLVLTEFPPSIGGMQAHAIHLARHLHDRGHQVEVVTYRNPLQEAADFDARLPFPVHRTLSRLSHWHNLDTVCSMGRRADIVYSSTVFYGLVGDRAGVPVVCRSAGNDVQRPWIAYPFKFASNLLSQPWLDERLYSAFRRWRSPEWTQSLFRQARQHLMIRSARANQYVLANSAFTNALLRDLGIPAKRREVLPGGVDTARFARPLIPRERNSRRLLTVCRLVPKKGIDFLLTAFAQYRDEEPGATLTIVGDGPLRTRYEAIAAQLGLGDSVHFTGRVPFERVAEYYWSADAFILPSRDEIHESSGTRDVETMGRVLCEANAAGIPVLAARCGGVPSVIRDKVNGLLFPPGDTEALLTGLRRVFADSTLRSKLIGNGIRIARQQFDWSVIMKRHEKIFDNVRGKAKPENKRTKKLKARS